ncbi:MAG: putative signal transducing protein [Chromatiales bacterium]
MINRRAWEMKRVFCAADRVLVGFLKGVLDDHGIACVVRNDYLAGGIGELPPQECWPELCVLDEAEAATAERIVESTLARQPDTGARWRCPRCGEWLEPQFQACWRCAEDR